MACLLQLAAIDNLALMLGGGKLITTKIGFGTSLIFIMLLILLEGDLYKKRKELVRPIQDKVYNAIQDLSNEKRYDIIFDKSSNLIMLFSNPMLLDYLANMPRAKIFLIALVWSIVSVVLVTLENKSFYSFDTLLLFISRFSFVLAITIPFDIRDLKYDDLSLKTIPQIFGEQKAKTIALYCLAFFELISIFHFFVGDFSWQILLALMLTSLLSGILIIKSSQEKNNLFFSFWVEGASIIMYLLLFIIPLAFGILAP